MFWNDGQLPENWTVERLSQKHASKPYNPDIANAVFRCGYIESWGRGTIKIIERCVEAGLPKPSYKYETSGLWVIFNKDIYTFEYLNSLDLNDRQIKAVLYTKENGKITNSEYQEINDIGKTTATEELAELVSKGFYKPTGKGRGAKYELN
jgi:ATP-dependent DNA helicase RecG